MKTQIINTGFAKDLKETVSGLVLHTRNRVISAADVWNIQRNKRTFAQRRFCI